MALVACLAAAGVSQIAWTIGLGVIAVVAAVAGSVWVFCSVVAWRGSCASRPTQAAEFFEINEKKAMGPVRFGTGPIGVA